MRTKLNSHFNEINCYLKSIILRSTPINNYSILQCINYNFKLHILSEPASYNFFSKKILKTHLTDGIVVKMMVAYKRWQSFEGIHSDPQLLRISGLMEVEKTQWGEISFVIRRLIRDGKIWAKGFALFSK